MGTSYPVIFSIWLVILHSLLILTTFPRTSTARFMNSPSVCILKMSSLKGCGCIDLYARMSYIWRGSCLRSLVKLFRMLVRATLGIYESEVIEP